MPKIIHFDFMAKDADRAIKFYSKVFNWKFDKWENPDPDMQYWLITAGPESEPGINGGMSLQKDLKPMSDRDHAVYFCTIGVPDADEYTKKIEAGGGKIMMPKSPIPGVGWLATFMDIEGNMAHIMQEDQEVK